MILQDVILTFTHINRQPVHFILVKIILINTCLLNQVGVFFYSGLNVLFQFRLVTSPTSCTPMSKRDCLFIEI